MPPPTRPGVAFLQKTHFTTICLRSCLGACRFDPESPICVNHDLFLKRSFSGINRNDFRKTPVPRHSHCPLDPAATLFPVLRNRVSLPVRTRKLHIESCRAAPLPSIPVVSFSCIGHNGLSPSRTPREGRRVLTVRVSCVTDDAFEAINL